MTSKTKTYFKSIKVCVTFTMSYFYSHSQSRAGAPGKTARWRAENVSCLTVLTMPSLLFTYYCVILVMTPLSVCVCVSVCALASTSISFCVIFPRLWITNSAIRWDWLTVCRLSSLKGAVFQNLGSWSGKKSKYDTSINSKVLCVHCLNVAVSSKYYSLKIAVGEKKLHLFFM